LQAAWGKYRKIDFNYYICKMKIVFIALCFAFTAFAQEKQEENEEYKNFTNRQRYGTWGLNTVAPGLGSILIMEDWEGARNQWLYFGIGAGAIWGLVAKGGIDTGPSSFDIGGVMLLMAGAFYLGQNFVYNITRSAYYDNPQYKSGYKNFTNGQRLGTIVLNIIPGLGSAVIMEDWEGVGVQWALTGGGTLIGFTLADSREQIKACVVVFSVLNTGYNINRSSTYNKPDNLTLDKYSKNFTNGQRLGTIVLNIIPGLGSAVIMEDWEGAVVQWVLNGAGLVTLALLGSKEQIKPALVTFSALNLLYSIPRSLTYDKSENLTLGKHDGFHLSVLPNRHSQIMPYLLFNKVF
jgi:hypothetical protein